MIYAGTGHRPQFLPCKFDETSYWLKRCILDLEYWMEENLHEIEYIITGGALGWDTWLAESSLKLEIPFKVYVPFEKQDRWWSHQDKTRYKQLLKNADDIILVQKKYSKRAFLERDRRMVDSADKMIALWNPGHKSGGTYYTICYAESQQKEVINFWRD